MTENKRFTAIRKKNQVSKEMGNYVQDRGTTILKLGFLEDCKDVCDILNELHEENQQIRDTITEMYNNERTQMGKNTLKQLMEALP